jgi:cellulose biosynthesis protein BcsQ
MSVSKILLADKDQDYASALAMAVSNINNEFEISMANLESFNQKLGPKISFHEYDLILLGGYPDETAESIRRKSEERTGIVILSDDIVESLPKQVENAANHFWYIYRFSNVNDIISDLNYLAGLLTGKKSMARKSFEPELIGFYSISGGTGKSVTAIGLARELSRFRDKKVLYLSFEEIPATELFLGNHSQNRNIGDYLYYLFEKENHSMCSRPEGFTTTDHYGVETFCPTKGRNDLGYLTQQELIHFLKVVSDCCRYDYIALDLKSDLSEDTLFLMNLCGKILLIQNDDPVSEHKTSKLIAYLDQMNFNGLRDRILLTVNRTSGAEYDHEEYGDILYSQMKKLYIEKDDNSFRYASGHMDIDINHAFGVGIKKMADELLLQNKAEEK